MRLPCKILMICHFVLMSTILNFAQETASRIYYYDFNQMAFVSETVTGEDAKVIVEYELPDGHEIIVGDGFSPSGSWFVWTSGRFGAAKDNYLNIQVFNLQSSEHFTWSPGDGQQVQFMKWLPSDDILVIVFSDNSDVHTEFYALYDPTNNNLVVGPNSVTPNFELQNFDFSPNGQYINLTYSEFSIIFDTVNFSEHIIRIPFVGVKRCRFGLLPHWLENQTLSYLVEEQTSIQISNFEKDETLSLTTAPSIIKAVDWSPNGNYGLVYSAGENHSLWLLDRNSAELNLIDENITFFDNCSSPLDKTSWNDSSHYAYYIDSNYQPRIITSDGNLLSMPDLNERQIVTGTHLFWLDINLMFSAYDPSLNKLDIFQFNPINQDLVELTSDFDMEFAGISPVSVASGYIIFSNHIYDTSLSTWYPISPDFDEITSALVSRGENLNYEWAFLEGWSSPTHTPIFIINLATGNIRFVTICEPSAVSCYGQMYNR